ncbi:hypothetical protein JSE7799_01611 [Jannaschia seosinensis]|uniref:Uncharacterized protein n=1 Tax=Jannaschia seosinensis TaxID=313367 RepID=A0A0M7BAP5_9RHOB|nr:hypothetical protein JSE7799_01611 [Jannaschia seosinensis]
MILRGRIKPHCGAARVGLERGVGAKIALASKPVSQEVARATQSGVMCVDEP